jgi:histidine triad (HIT) family protein
MTASNSQRPICIFCEIIAERLPASIAYRDQDWLVLMDIHPITEAHALIIPTRHCAHLSDIDAAGRQALFDLAAATMAAQESAGFSIGGANLLLNDGIAANQHIPHLHLHCIPRKNGDLLAFARRMVLRTVGIFGFRVSLGRLDRIAEKLAPLIKVRAI